MIVKLSNEDRVIVEAFADARELNDAKLYKKRGGFKREDLICGALAELAAFKYLHDTDTPVTYPDFTIHKKKSFGADLTYNELKFHIKGQTLESEKKYGCSFLFQKSDKLVSKPSKDDIIVMCVVDINENIVYIKKELYANEVIWGKPKIKWLEYNKTALYLEEQL
jgi:hypothetical protein